MTPEMEALGRRALAWKGWRWMPGMRALQYGVPASLCWLDKQGRWNACDDRGVWLRFADMTCLTPDLTDPATLGCLLALVREAWGEPMACLFSGAGGWVVLGELTQPDIWYPTEAEALVAALEAAPAEVEP